MGMDFKKFKDFVKTIKVADYRDEKVCANCGKSYTNREVRVIDFGGSFWWDCTCKTTITIYHKKLNRG